MHSLNRTKTLAIVLAACLSSCGGLSSAQAAVRLPHLLGSHMVLQRDREIPIWGWAEPGEEVIVHLADQQASAKADASGHWKVRLPAMSAGGPHVMTVAGKNTITLDDVLVGEVWIASGQSNMDMGILGANDAAREVAAARYPEIRLFHIEHITAAQPKEDVDAQWYACSPETVAPAKAGSFSAVAFFFARELHKELKVPIGIVHSAWGGTRIEPWTPKEGFTAVEPVRDDLKKIDEAHAKYDKIARKAVAGMEKWLTDARQALAEGKPVTPPPAWPAHPLETPSQPTAIYNAMIHPLLPFAIRGAIWYQGESNAPDGMLYRDRMKALISGWRQLWNVGDFPFYYVQIAPLETHGTTTIYQGETLPRLWEAQTAAMAIPNTGMVVTNDITDLHDIHPKNKQDVGKRLALWALAKTYGRENLVYSGPMYKSMNVEGGKIRIRFDSIGGGLASRDGKPLNWFTIAGEDRKFVEAKATIDGETIVVESDQVAQPVAVRFAWNMVATPNLMNKEGLPASAFRTDAW